MSIRSFACLTFTSSLFLSTTMVEAKESTEDNAIFLLSRNNISQISFSKSNVIAYGHVETWRGDRYDDFPNVYVYSWNTRENEIGSVMDEVINGQQVQIVSEFSILYEIKMPYGRTGYIYKGNVNGIVSCLGNNSRLTNCR